MLGENRRANLLSDVRSSLLNFSMSIGVMSLVARCPKNSLSGTHFDLLKSPTVPTKTDHTYQTHGALRGPV